LKDKDRESEIYKKIEQVIPGSKVIEFPAKYSEWFYLEDSQGADLLIRTMFRIGRNIVQLIIIKFFAESYEKEKDYSIYEYEIPQTETHWNFDLWENEDPKERKVPKSYFAESNMNVDQLILFSAQQMELRGK
jgi:hypothetical protein